MISRTRQRGVALVLALIITTIVAAISIKLSWQFDLSLSRNSNRWFGFQADAHLKGLERYALMVLEADLLDNKFDHNNEFWASDLSELLMLFGDYEEIIPTLSIEDAQGRFNLNLLEEPLEPAASPTAPIFQRLTTSQKRFIRLLQTIDLAEEEKTELGEEEPDSNLPKVQIGSVEYDHIPVFLTEAQALEIGSAIIDWIDKDNRVMGFGGAEADYYASLDPPITPRNGRMLSVTELRLIKGMDEEPFKMLYERLLPLVIALESDTPINVNSMPLEMFRIFNSPDNLQPLPIQAADNLQSELLAQEEGYFQSPENFANSPELEVIFGVTENNSNRSRTPTNNNEPSGESNQANNANNPNNNSASSTTMDLSRLSVNSEYFIVTSGVEFEDTFRTSKSLIRRHEVRVTTSGSASAASGGGITLKTYRYTDANF